MASNRGLITQHEMPLCCGKGKRRQWWLIGGKCMGGNPSQGLAMARDEFGELTRFGCILLQLFYMHVIRTCQNEQGQVP